MLTAIIVCAIALAALVLVCTQSVKRHIDAGELRQARLARVHSDGRFEEYQSLCRLIGDLPKRRKPKAPKAKVAT